MTRVLVFAGVLALMGCKNEAVSPKPEPRGPKWVVFNRQNSGIVSDTVNAIVYDGGGGLWFGTVNGASNFHEGTWSNYKTELEFPAAYGASRKVDAVAVGVDQTVWFGLAGGGIRRFNRSIGAGASWTSYAAPSLTSNVILSLAADITGRMWVGTSQGAMEFVPAQLQNDPLAGSWRSLARGSLVPVEPIYALAIDPTDNTIWFGTYSRGVVWYDGDQDWNIDAPRDSPFPVTSLAFDAGGVAWLATFGDGAYKYSVATNEWTHYSDTSAAGLLPPVTAAVATDHRGTVWFGTDQGVFKFDGTAWSSFTHANSPLPNDAVKATFVDNNGNLWIGTEGGVAVYNENGTKF